MAKIHSASKVGLVEIRDPLEPVPKMGKWSPQARPVNWFRILFTGDEILLSRPDRGDLGWRQDEL